VANRNGSGIGHFTTWLTAFGDAWEAADAPRMASLFVVGATLQPTPFVELLRGRKQIEAYFEELVAGVEGVEFSAEALGAGKTYGVAHWRVAARVPMGLGGPIPRVRDGVLVCALDPRGRCTSLRWWWHETEEPPQDSLAMTQQQQEGS